jgi:Skp family chaperone for outer membrane proteins
MPDALRLIRSIVVACFVTAVFAATTFAQEIDATKVGAINLSYVARMSKAGKEGLARIDDASRKRAADIEVKATELQNARVAAQKPGLGLTDRALADLQRAFEKSKTELDRMQEDARTEIESMQTQFELEFRAKLDPVIDEVSKEKGLQFVFGLEQAAIIWWSPAVDISEEVVKRLDAGK